MRRRRYPLADKTGADQAGQADAEDGQRQTGGDLIDRKAERHQREHQRQQRARENPAERADEDRARKPGAAESAGGADDHHAFDAEIEHARALGHQFAGGRDQQRRRCRQHRQDDRFKQPHGTPFAALKSGGSGRG